MTDRDGGSMLLVHHRDLSTPIGTTTAYYVADRLTETHTVHVVCRKRAKEHADDHDQRATLHHVATGDVPLLSPLLFHLVATLYVALLALRHRYDAVFTYQHTTVQARLGALAAGARFVVNLPSVPVRQGRDFSEHAGTPSGPRKRITAALMSGYAAVVGHLLRRSDAVVCLTEGIREVTEAAYGIDLSDAAVIGMGVDVETFTAASERAASEVPDDHGGGPTLTYIGAITPPRGLEEVLEALAALDRDVTVTFAGQGPDEYERRLLARAEEVGVGDRVDWRGLVPHREIPDLLARSTVTLSPLPDIESYRVSFPAKLLEYMAAGTQVVATDITPHRTLVDDGENGYLYDGSRAGLVAAVERALDDDDRDAVVARARETARAHDWNVVVEAYEAVIFGTHETHDSAVADPRKRRRGAGDRNDARTRRDGRDRRSPRERADG